MVQGVITGPFEISYVCDAFVDQGRFIGSDPVGFKCHMDAVYESENGILLCQEHEILFKQGSHRLTFVSPWGRTRQDGILNFISLTKQGE